MLPVSTARYVPRDSGDLDWRAINVGSTISDDTAFLTIIANW